MRVVEAVKFGDPEVLVAREAPDPVAGPGQVIIKVDAADVLFLDTQLRAGWGQDFFALTPPYVPGGGVAGQVVTVGQDVDAGWVGRRVITRTGTHGGAGDAPTGGYAERAVVAAERPVEVPDGLDLHAAVALVHDGPTALGLTNTARIRPEEWVLVTAAGGSLGVVLVQLARAAGARVIGAARGTRKLDLLRELGAEAVDYTQVGWVERVGKLTGGHGMDVVFDGAGGPLGRDAFQATARGARFFAYGSASGEFAHVAPEEAERRAVTWVGVMDQAPDADGMRQSTIRALAEAVAGRIRPFVGQTFPLDRAADAHAAIADRATVGRTLLLT